MNDIYNLVKEVFPKTEILLIYYGGSIAYGLHDESSDIDLTVVLDDFKGNMHLSVGQYDLFVFSKERFIKRQAFDESVISYHRAAADNILDVYNHLVYVKETFSEKLMELSNIVDHKQFMINHIEAELEYGRMRFALKNNFKSHYHVFRIRGMIEHYKKTKKYELIVEEPWYSKMMDFKKNWDNKIGTSYTNEIKDQLDHLENYRKELIDCGME